MEAVSGDRWTEFGPWEICRAAQQGAALEAAARAYGVTAYRDAWDQAGLEDAPQTFADWAGVPFLSKDLLIEGAAAQPPFGGRLGVARERLAHVFVAPGPLYMPFTAADLAQAAGSFAKALTACGIEPGDIVDQTTMYNWVIAATVMDQALLRIGCAVVPGGIGQSERHLEVIRSLGVTAIVAFPTFLEHLLELAASDGRGLPVQKAVVMGELSRPDTKQRLRAEHGVEVREFYGAADVGAIAWECSAGAGMHLRDDLLVEFIVPGGTAATTPGLEQPAELVVTDFHRRAMPIIRLRTGDLVDEVITGACPCGRTSPRIGRIVGRASEITKVKGMFVVPRQVQDILRRNGLEQPFRLIVERRDGVRDHLTLEMAQCPPDRLGAVQADVESALRMRIEMRLAADLPADGPRLVDRRLHGA